MLWRVHHRTVNPVPRGKHSRFESVVTHQINAPVFQLVEKAVLEAVKCQFESDRGHHI